MTRIHYSDAELASLREALRASADASAEAPDDIAGASTESDDESAAPVSPRATAANRLSLLAGGYGDICAGRGDVSGAAVCRVLGDTCFYVVDPLLRPRMLDIAGRALAALEGASAVGAWMPGVVEELQTLFAEVKPADDDAEPIARAMGMTVEEAAAFGLTGHITMVGLDEDEDDGYGREDDGEFAETEDLWEQESLETLFRRDARTLVSATLPRALQRYWKNQASMDTLLEVRRAFHTLKGAARHRAGLWGGRPGRPGCPGRSGRRHRRRPARRRLRRGGAGAGAARRRVQLAGRDAGFSTQASGCGRGAPRRGRLARTPHHHAGHGARSARRRRGWGEAGGRELGVDGERHGAGRRESCGDRSRAHGRGAAAHA